MLARLLGLLLVLVASPVYAATFWDDEMENSSTRFNTSGFLVGTLIPGGTMAFDTGVKFSGTGSIRLNYPAACASNTTQCGGAVSAPITPTDDLWQRVYFRMSGAGPNTTPSGLFDVNDFAYTKMMKTQNGSSFPRSWATMGQNSYSFSLQAENVPNTGQTNKMTSNISFVNNRWYCIETHQKMNTVSGGVYNADGIAELFVDGASVIPAVTNVLYRNPATTTTALWTEVGIFRQVGVGNIWYDRWATGNTRIGCVGAVTPPDTTPPSPPTSLTAQ